MLGYTISKRKNDRRKFSLYLRDENVDINLGTYREGWLYVLKSLLSSEQGTVLIENSSGFILRFCDEEKISIKYYHQERDKLVPKKILSAFVDKESFQYVISGIENDFK